MELVKGQTLDEIVRRQAPFSATEATLIGIDLCRALAAVHAAGILHGDIKAHNVMREEGGRTVLMDFGTGRDLKRQLSGAGGDFAGTPLYLAPEVFAGHHRTMASEIYSVGVLLYFLVSGSYPVEGDTRTVIRQLHDQRSARKPLRDVRPDLPDRFIRVVERSLAERPEERFESPGTLESALAQVLPTPQPPPPSPAPTLKLALVVLAVVSLGLGALTVYRLRNAATGEEAQGPVTSSPPVEYRIDAAFYREQTGAVERLRPGTQLSRDESLSLQVEVSAPVYVYVVNEDERGESYLLFPLPGLALTNPLPPGQRHRLPGRWNGEAISWQVTSEGQKEHFLILASPERSAKFEEIFATLPQPSFGGPPARKLSTDEIGILRSVGGLTSSPARVDRQLRFLPEFSTPLAAAEERVRGVWIRHVTFDNPVK
jgi:serine/threonine protein kinase